MTSPVTATTLSGGIALLERAMGYTLGALQLVTPQDMGRPTPCRDWDLHDLLLHMNDSLLTMHGAVTTGHVDLDTNVDVGRHHADYGEVSVDPVGSLRNRACAMIGVWAAARGPTEISIAELPLASGLVAAIGAVEVAVHGWDVARACGRDRPLPPGLAERLLELSRSVVDDGDRPLRFATAVPVPTSAGPSDELLAFLGRQP